MPVSDHLPGILKNKNLPAVIIALICSFLVFPVFFEFLVFPVPNTGASWLTLDPSWKLTLNKINLDHINWGNDFILTYGPLSYLSTRVGWGLNRIQFLAFDLFTAFNFFFIFYTAFRHGKNKLVALLLIFSSALVLPAYFGSGTALLLLAFLLFWIRQSTEEGRPFFYLMQVVLCLLLFFIKFNTGFVAFVFFIAAVLYKLIFTKENKLLPGIYPAVFFAGIFILSGALNVSLWPYIKGGLNLVSGHNQIMYYNGGYTTELWFSVVVVFLSALALLINLYTEQTSRYKQALILALFSASLYILYKQGFVRADANHILEFYRYVPLFLLCMPDLYNAPRNYFSGGITGVVICIVLFFSNKFDAHLFSPGSRLVKSGYVQGFRQFTDSSGIRLYPNNNQLPQHIIARIGKSSADVYPWNIHLLIENRLNYLPRPVPQSYLAYTPYLENLNFNFYQSGKAPEYVCYEYDAIDGRYSLFDEPKLHLVLFKNYSCVDTFSFAGRPVLLLKRNAEAPVQLQKIREYNLQLTDKITPRPGVYYELDVSTAKTGQVFSLVRYSPELNLCITTKSGEQRIYRTSPYLLKSGLFSCYLFNTTEDIFNFMKADSLPAANKIAGYSLQPAHAFLFRSKIKVTEYRIN